MTTALVPVYRRSELEAVADGCLYRYKALWIDGVDDSSDISLVGTAFAKVKHLYLERLVDCGLDRDAEEAKAAFIEGVAISQLPARLIPELREVWEYHVAHFTLDLKRFVAAEERGADGQVTWAPDLVLAHPEANALEIVDDKSGWKPPLTEDELKGLFQARVYARYARDRWPNFAAYYFTIHAVRFNKSTTVAFTQAELDTVDVEIQAAIATIELAKQSGVWPAIPGTACRFCELKCPLAEVPATLPKRLTEEQYQEVGMKLIPAEKNLRAIKKLLKAAVATYGPLNVNGIVWDNYPSVQRTYPVEAVMAAMKKLGVDRQAGDVRAMGGDMTLSHSALKKVFKDYPDLETALEFQANTKTVYRFAAKAAGESAEEEE